LSIVIPPVNVPVPMWIVSPSCAASSAACMVAKQPGWLLTHKVAVAADCAAALRLADASTTNASTTNAVPTAMRGAEPRSGRISLRMSTCLLSSRDSHPRLG
jgi:hypothetical protein